MMQKTRLLFFFLFIAIALLPYAIQIQEYWHYTNDDAYITFRYSRNLVEGRGPVFNADEYVEGYTNFLQMLQAALIIYAFDPFLAPDLLKLIGVFYGAGCIVLTFFLFKAIFPSFSQTIPEAVPLAGALAASAIVAISPSFAVNSTSGLETVMFAFWLVLGLFLSNYERTTGKRHGSAAAFSLLVLTRPEGIFLFGVYWTTCVGIVLQNESFWRCRKHKFNVKNLIESNQIRMLLKDCAVVMVVVLAHLAFRYIFYDGELLPNTYYAKQGGFWKGTCRSYVIDGLLTPLFGFTGGGAAVAGMITARRDIPQGLLPLAAVAAAGCVAVIFTGIDWMVGHRLVIPYLPVVAVLVVSGWTFLLTRSNRLGKPSIVFVLLLTLPTAWLMQDPARKRFEYQTLARSLGYQTGHVALAKWIASKAVPGDCVALMDIGIIGYACIDLRILDVTGLTDRHIAKAEGGFLRKTYDPAYIIDKAPEFIVLTFRSPGRSYTVPIKEASLTHWSQVEADLARHPEFIRWYKNKSVPLPDNQTDWLDALAADIGAKRVFEHGHPYFRYLLAVFRRDTESANTVQ